MPPDEPSADPTLSAATLSSDVPRGAFYGPQPPLYPRAGTFWFSTGALVLTQYGRKRTRERSGAFGQRCLCVVAATDVGRAEQE